MTREEAEALTAGTVVYQASAGRKNFGEPVPPSITKHTIAAVSPSKRIAFEFLPVSGRWDYFEPTRSGLFLTYAEAKTWVVAMTDAFLTAVQRSLESAKKQHDLACDIPLEEPADA